MSYVTSNQLVSETKWDFPRKVISEIEFETFLAPEPGEEVW